MPSSLSCAELRMKSAFHEGIFDACWLRFRPIKERNVGTSGTNGVGRGTRPALARVCRCRVCEAILNCVKGRRKDGIDRNCVDLTFIAHSSVRLISRRLVWEIGTFYLQ
jgi:hypothetical protein